MVLKEFSLDGKVAIITGASRGIGKAIALTMAEAGADIVVAARTASYLEQTAKEVTKLGRKCLAIPTDVTTLEQVEQMVEKTIAEFGKIDILVNNAGIDIRKPAIVTEGANTKTAISMEEWDKVLETNLHAAFFCCRSVGHYMIKQRRGKVINVGADEGEHDGVNDVAYAVSKASLLRFTKALAEEWAQYNINVNILTPGLQRTAIWENPELKLVPEENERRLQAMTTNLGRWGELREVGVLAVFLASDAANYITGEIIRQGGSGIDGH
ncbi:MAG: SDR family NAD(P)-dependent oxidoreductase [Dehalococcoidales bacterium]